ncbi:hypothetical protein EC9_25600 [Rosistilla ulvae]|uniref:Uncharacterized protein n=1 Tax=Rosistilla ulvae TaxID=1930277 RepID=A0A517M0G3_9BACT|nr:hypothetical protein [Rosistilla ulvae]QDS88370.1 hypothetical protein EC9_25600 [Rosistilla ulvae]
MLMLASDKPTSGCTEPHILKSRGDALSRDANFGNALTPKKSNTLPLPGNMRSLGLCLLMLLHVGCGSSDQITTYTIPTEVPESLIQQDRMLGGIVPATQKVWFYKLVADVDSVAEIESDFKKWVQQLKYEDGVPQLDVPDDWKRISPGMMQHAKFQIPAGERVIEMSVAELGNNGDWDEQVLANVNRWRGQMALPPETGQYAGGEALTVENPPSESQPIWVSIDGVFKSGPSMGGRPPMMGGGGGAMPPHATPPVAAESDSPRKYDYELPEGWTEGRSGGMRLAAFDVATDDGAAEVTLIEAGGDMQANIGMWMSQVNPKSKPDDAAGVLESGEEITVMGITGTRFRLYGDEGGEKAIDVTMVPLEGGSSLFIKMTGVPAAVKAADQPLTEFLGTIKPAAKG